MNDALLLVRNKVDYVVVVQSLAMISYSAAEIEKR